MLEHSGPAYVTFSKLRKDTCSPTLSKEALLLATTFPGIDLLCYWTQGEYPGWGSEGVSPTDPQVTLAKPLAFCGSLFYHVGRKHLERCMYWCWLELAQVQKDTGSCCREWRCLRNLWGPEGTGSRLSFRSNYGQMQLRL